MDLGTAIASGIGAFVALSFAVAAVLGWRAASSAKDATLAQAAKTSTAKVLAADLVVQVNDKTTELKAAQAEVETLKIVKEAGNADPTTEAWLQYAINSLGAHDLPLAELVADSIELGLHPDNLQGREGADTDANSETRAPGTGLPIIRSLALHEARDAGPVDAVLPVRGQEPGGGESTESAGGEVADA